MNQQVIDAINKLLLAGEPANISVDSYSDRTGYKPQAIVDACNDVLGLGSWGFEELSSEIVDGDKGPVAVAKVKVWLKDVDFQPAAWGQARVTKGDVGDARKGAQTDAMKKALSYFSIGNRAYHGLLDANAPAAQPATDEQVKRIEAYCKSLKREVPGALAFDEADALLRELFAEYNKQKAS